MARIDAFFKLMNDEGASDLHMVAGQQPVLRIRGDMGIELPGPGGMTHRIRAQLIAVSPRNRLEYPFGSDGFHPFWIDKNALFDRLFYRGDVLVLSNIDQGIQVKIHENNRCFRTVTGDFPLFQRQM